jgi:hypothetical protein
MDSVTCSKVGSVNGFRILVPTGNTSDVVYKEVLCRIFIIRTYHVAFPRRRGRDVTLAFSGIIYVITFYIRHHHH